MLAARVERKRNRGAGGATLAGRSRISLTLNPGYEAGAELIQTALSMCLFRPERTKSI